MNVENHIPGKIRKGKKGEKGNIRINSEGDATKQQF